MDGALLQLVGSSVELALRWYPIPGRRSGPLGVGQQHPRLGERPSLAGPALSGRAGLKRLPDTWHNIALLALPGPGAEKETAGPRLQTQGLWFG